MEPIFINLGWTEIEILTVILLFIIALGNYGRNTALGYWGSVLLAIVATPPAAFIVILYLRINESKARAKKAS